MLSIANVKAGRQAEHYYSAKDDYYTAKQGKAPSQWQGQLALELKLEGEVKREDFQAMLAGLLPDGTHIHHGGAGRRGGTDLTFSAPKSVSIQALAMGDARLIAAHERSVAVALKHAEILAATRDGETTGKLLIASWTHATSRELDPQLHTHNVVINLTKKANGDWRAINNRALYHNKMLLSTIYRAELAREVRALGYQIRRTGGKHGEFELGHITRAQIEVFSTRSKQIEASLEERGLDRQSATNKQLDRETLATRKPKRQVDRALLAERWREQAAALGVERDAQPITKAKTIAQAHLIDSPLQAVDYAIQHLVERSAVVRTDDVAKTAMSAGLGFVTFPQIQRDLARREREGETLQRQGELTTREMLRAERQILRIAKAGRQRTAPIASQHAVTTHLERTNLNEGQRRAVTLITTSRDRVVGVQGRAGTGKTTMLAEVKRIAEANSFRVLGLGPSGRAVQELTLAGVESQTIASFTLAQDKGIDDKTVLVMDEAGMVPTLSMRDVLRSAQRSNAKVVVIGDERQLKAVEAGRPFGQLYEHGAEFALMEEIQRQKEPRLLEAVRAASQGNILESIARMQPQTVEIADDGSRYRHIAQEFAALPVEQRKDTLVITGTNEARDALNQAIRTELGRGETGEPIQTLRRIDYTQAQIKLVRHYHRGMVVEALRDYPSLKIERGQRLQVEGRALDHVKLRHDDGNIVEWQPARHPRFIAYEERTIRVRPGERLQFTQGNRTLGYKNRELAEVKQIDPLRRELIVRRNNGAELRMALDAAHTIDYGYATTTHGSQGATVDRVLADLDTRTIATNDASYYVQISRARHEAKIYTNDKSKLPAAVLRHEEKSAALDLVRGASKVGSRVQEHEHSLRGLTGMQRD